MDHEEEFHEHGEPFSEEEEVHDRTFDEVEAELSDIDEVEAELSDIDEEMPEEEMIVMDSVI